MPAMPWFWRMGAGWWDKGTLALLGFGAEERGQSWGPGCRGAREGAGKSEVVQGMGKLLHEERIKSLGLFSRQRRKAEKIIKVFTKMPADLFTTSHSTETLGHSLKLAKHQFKPETRRQVSAQRQHISGTLWPPLQELVLPWLSFNLRRRAEAASSSPPP